MRRPELRGPLTASELFGARELAMKVFQVHSIRFRLAAVFLFFLMLIIALGLFSIRRLSDFNAVTLDIRNGLLPNTRIIGDLNNYTSDYRAAEMRRLMAASEAEIAATEQELRYLDDQISIARRSYQQISHEPAEAVFYDDFAKAWTDYRKIVATMWDLSAGNRKLENLEAYKMASVAAFNAVSDLLGKMYDWNEQRASAAIERANTAYVEAIGLICLAIVIAAILAIGALLFVSRSISRPLVTLAKRMRELAKNEIEVNVQGNNRYDEIGEMARAVIVFRNNAIELMTSRQTLAEQKMLLEEQLVRERQLTLRQRNFVSMASHEFRTPLTIIDGHARRLAKVGADTSTKDIVTRAEKIRQAALRMTTSIEDLLSSSRLVDGEAKTFFRPAPIELVSLLQDVCKLQRDISPGSNITEEFEASPLPMIGDQQLLSQAFGNLLSNAIKYSPRGSPIRVCTRRDRQWIAVAVRDQGIGIPQDELDQVFECYCRGSNVSGIVGTGIGLYLVKTIANMHDGEVLVESKEGEGSLFIVRLSEGRKEQTRTTLKAESA